MLDIQKLKQLFGKTNSCILLSRLFFFLSRIKLLFGVQANFLYDQWHYFFLLLLSLSLINWQISLQHPFLAGNILIRIKLAADLTPYFCNIIMTICFIIDARKFPLFKSSFRQHYFLCIIHAYSMYNV